MPSRLRQPTSLLTSPWHWLLPQLPRRPGSGPSGRARCIDILPRAKRVILLAAGMKCQANGRATPRQSTLQNQREVLCSCLCPPLEGRCGRWPATPWSSSSRTCLLGAFGVCTIACEEHMTLLLTPCHKLRRFSGPKVMVVGAILSSAAAFTILEVASISPGRRKILCTCFRRSA